MAQKVTAFDTETHLFSNGNWAPQIVCLQHDNGCESGILVGDDILPFARDMLGACLRGEILVGQNTAYDMAVLAAAYPELMPLIFDAYDSGNIHCTRLRERLLDIAKGATGPQTRQRGYYSMDALVERRNIPVKIDKQNPWRLRFAELEHVPLEEWPEEAVHYAKDDATATLLIYLSQDREALVIPYEDPSGEPCFSQEAARQAGFDFALHLMHCWGVRTDMTRVEALTLRTDASLAELVPELVASGVMNSKGRKNMTAIKGLVEDCFAAAGAELPTTPKGSTKTDKETLKTCNDPTLAKVIKHSFLTKVKSTYVSKLLEGVAGNIHASFHTLGADTGRTSSSGPNLQNQSRDGGIRECFVPRKGFVFLSADYDSQELRTLAQACLDLCGRSELASKFQEDPDFDPHTDFAAGMMGWTYKDAMTRKAAGDKEVKERRRQSKAANFGFPGGMGAKNFRLYARGYEVELTEEEAKELRDRWFKQWPEMTQYFKIITCDAEIGQLQQLRSHRIRGGVGFCDSANSYFQGLASDASKTAVYLVAKACYSEPDSPLYGSRPVMLVHDEVVLETPEAKGPEAALELQRLMVEAMAMWCPDVPARATPVLARCWSKDAKPLYENGRLVPWDLPAEEVAK